jgi:hypothetical protein
MSAIRSLPAKAKFPGEERCSISPKIHAVSGEQTRDFPLGLYQEFRFEYQFG